MVRHEVISKRLRKLDEYLAILHGLSRYTYEEFINNPEHYGSVERFLQLALETIADIGSGFMVIYNNNIVDYGIITHEATHAWARDKWGSYFPPADTDYMAAILSGEPPITPYGGTDAAEDLAEAVRYYAYSPEFLKAQCPLRYAIVERMMTDPSYYG